jgi:hypothetical protein
LQNPELIVVAAATPGLKRGGEPDPRHLQRIAVAASFRT